MTVYFDVSKLVDEPRRSGIQRVERALIGNWPGGGLVLCRFDKRAAVLRVLPDAVAGLLCRDAPDGGMVAERAALGRHLEAAGEVVPAGARLLCAELFDDAGRAGLHRAAGRRAHWVVYDFLPFLHPEWFPAGPANRLMPYLHAMGAVRRAYISPATKRDAARVFRVDCDGPVLALGADGLGLERQAFSPDRRDFVLLGTIEARKNVAAAIEAFRLLWSEGCAARLVLIGAVERDALVEQALLREFEGEARLVQCGAVSDAALRETLRGARALLFPSQGEGYGLPAVEALHSGLPVIVAADLPALEGLSGAGQIRLASPDAAAIAGAVRAVLADEGCLWRNAAGLRLPGWEDFARTVAGWVTG